MSFAARAVPGGGGGFRGRARGGRASQRNDFYLSLFSLWEALKCKSRSALAAGRGGAGARGAPSARTTADLFQKSATCSGVRHCQSAAHTDAPAARTRCVQLPCGASTPFVGMKEI